MFKGMVFVKKILFVTYGGGHVNLVYPIIKALKNYKNIEVSIIALTTAIKYFKDRGDIEYKTLSYYFNCFDKETKNNVYKYGFKLADKFHNPDVGFDYQESVMYYGFSMNDLVHDYGEEKAFELFKEKGRPAFLPRKTMKKILDIEQPDLVITSVPFRMAKAAVIEAQLRNIKTIFIQDYYIIIESEEWVSDYYFVLKESIKDYLIKQKNIDSKKIFVTGSPVFDSKNILKFANYSREDIYNDLKIDLNNKVIMVIIDAKNLTKLNDINEIRLAINTFKEYYFIIKLHPNEENVKRYTCLANEFKSRVKVIKNYNNQKLLYISDIVIGNISTLFLEALLYNKKIIRLDIDNTYYNLLKKEHILNQLSYPFIVNKKGLLCNMIANVLCNDYDYSKIKYSIFGNTENTLERILTNIKAILDV